MFDADFRNRGRHRWSDPGDDVPDSASPFETQTEDAGSVALPSLARLARWNWWAVVVSVPTLSLGMAAECCWNRRQRTATHLSFSDPLVVGSGIGWVVMLGFFCWLVSTKRAAAKQVALLTVWPAAFCC